MSTQTTEDRTTTPTRQMDAAIASARQRYGRRGGWKTMAGVVVVGAAAFAAGTMWGGDLWARWGPSGGAGTPAVAAAAGDTAAPAAAELWTCSMHPQVLQKTPGMCPICHMELTPVSAGGHDHGAGLTIDPVVVQNMGVRLAEVSRGPLVQSVRAVGYLEEPEPLHRDINLRVDGWIERLYANIDGMVISKGQPLFDLYSPMLTVAIEELIAARKQAEAADDAMARQMVEASRQKLLRMGLEAQQVEELAKAESAPATVPILAPLDGHLTAKMVYEGAAVEAGMLVMRLASRHRMWIDAQVPESQLALISDGQPVKATLVSQPGTVFDGKVLFVHPHLDRQTRTALVRIEIDNTDLALRQGMYATVEIQADAYTEAELIPREAVIDTGTRQVVFVALGEGRFEPRPVRLGLSGQDGWVQVVEGLKAGERVVSSGQFLLDTESRLKEAVAKHLSAGLPGHEPQSGPAKAELPAVAVPHLEEVVTAYLEIARKLGARQESDAPMDAAALLAASRRSAEHAGEEARGLVEKLTAASAAMEGKALADQRRAFVEVSEAMIAIVERSAVGMKLYVMHCPMAFDDAGARWVQETDTLANPFYATSMKRCGEIVATIEAGEKGAR